MKKLTIILALVFTIQQGFSYTCENSFYSTEMNTIYNVHFSNKLLLGWKSNNKEDGGIDEHPNQIGSINVSPNPITNQTTIKLSLPETNIIDNAISIFYNQGKIVDEIKIGTNPKIIWDRGNLPSGIYFMAIKTKNGNLSKKFIIL